MVEAGARFNQRSGDNSTSNWYFYARSLETQGGTVLSGYIANKGYIDFGASGKHLGPGVGFWVNR